MIPDNAAAAVEARCWSRIGVWGDKSCGELARFGHCRNCTVYRESGHELLDRPAPADYIDTWTALLARDKEADAGPTTPYVVFRVGQSWLGLRATVLREVTPPSAIRTIPHRSSELLLGLAAVRGEIHLCASLHALVGDGVAEPSKPGARFLVARHEHSDWLFPVDEVSGIYDIADASIEPVPSTLAHAPGVYTTGIAQCGERSVGLVDEALMFAALQQGDRVSSLNAFSMWDLFRSEVESQMRALTDNLLALETGGDAQANLAAAMRAAHSIKGAARIVQLDVGVRLSHAMEDCLVAAQEGSLTLGGDGVDVLLAAGDLLSRLSAVEEAGVAAWVEEQKATVDELMERLSALRAGTLKAAAPARAPAAPSNAEPAVERAPAAPAPDHAPPAQTAAPAAPPAPAASAVAPAAASSSGAASDAADRALRVSAQTLNRLIGLAGEAVVQTRWFEPFAESLLSMKRRQQEIADLLDAAQTNLEESPAQAADLVASARSRLEALRHSISERHLELETFALRSSGVVDRLHREMVTTRMRPFGDGVEGFPRLVRDVARQLGKQVRLEIHGRQTLVDRDILDRLEAPLTHMIRNCLDHGIETPDVRVAAGKPAAGTIRVEARHRAGHFALTVSDDGRGVDLDQLRKKIVDRGFVTSEMAAQLTEAELIEFLFLPGFTTAKAVSDLSGRGVGLDAVREMAKSVGGTARLTSRWGQGITLSMELPLTLSVVRTLVTEIGGEPFAFPLTRVAKTVSLPEGDLISLEGQQHFVLDGERIGVVPAHEVLGLGSKPSWSDAIPIVLVGERPSRYGLAVDRFLGEHDMVVRPLDPRLGKIRDVSALAVDEDGSPVLILDVDDLVRSLELELQEGRLHGLGRVATPTRNRRRILVVDDSITVREVERTLLANRGYEVDVAVDGVDGWNALRAGRYDLTVSDVDMPRMTGIELVSRIKADPRLKTMPVIIVSYKDREEDRLRGLEAGADRYMTKNSFHDETLLSAVLELIGPPL